MHYTFRNTVSKLKRITPVSIFPIVLIYLTMNS